MAQTSYELAPYVGPEFISALNYVLPLPKPPYTVVEFLTVGFVPEKHPIVGFSLADINEAGEEINQQTVFIDWRIGDASLPEGFELDRIPEKLAAQRIAYESQGKLHNVTLADIETGLPPADAWMVFANSTRITNLMVGHGLCMFTLPFINVWGESVGLIDKVSSPQLFDTGWYTKAIATDLVPVVEDGQQAYTERLKGARTTTKWGLSPALAGQCNIPLPPAKNVLEQNRYLTGKLVQHYQGLVNQSTQLTQS